MVNQYGVDGIMIGRGIFENLWVFEKSGIKPEKTLQEMLELLLKHARLFNDTWGKTKHFLILRRFFKIYVSKFPHAKELREKLMQTNSIEEVEKIISSLSKID